MSKLFRVMLTYLFIWAGFIPLNAQTHLPVPLHLGLKSAVPNYNLIKTEAQYINSFKKSNLSIDVEERKVIYKLFIYPHYQKLIGATFKENTSGGTMETLLNYSTNTFKFQLIKIVPKHHSSKIELALNFSVGKDGYWAYDIVEDPTLVPIENWLPTDLPHQAIEEISWNNALKHFSRMSLIAVEKCVFEKNEFIGNVFHYPSAKKRDNIFVAYKSADGEAPKHIKVMGLYLVKEGIKAVNYYDEVNLEFKQYTFDNENWFLAPITHERKNDPDLFFKVGQEHAEKGQMFILQLDGIPDPRIGYDEKGLFLANEWFQFTLNLQEKWKKEKDIDQQARLQQFLSEKSKTAFQIAYNVDGKEKILTDKRIIDFYKITGNWSVLLDSSGYYALFNPTFPEGKIDFNYKAVHYYPNYHFLALEGKENHPGKVVCLLSGYSQDENYIEFLVQGKELAARTHSNTYVFDSLGLKKKLDISGKILLESPRGIYTAIKIGHQGIILKNGQRTSLSETYFFTQIGSISDDGIVLGRANQAIAQDLNMPELALEMHFYNINSPKPKLVQKAFLLNATLLENGMVKGKNKFGVEQVYTLEGKMNGHPNPSLQQKTVHPTIYPAKLQASSLEKMYHNNSGNENEGVREYFSIQGFPDKRLRAIR